MLFHMITWFVTSVCVQTAVDIASESPAAPAPIAVKSSPVPAPRPKELTPRDELIQELTKILMETNSPDTFCVTIEVLQNLKADSPALIPVVIRNAERLGIFKDAIIKGGKKNQAALEAVDGVADVLDFFVQQIMGDDEDDVPAGKPVKQNARPIERVVSPGIDFNLDLPPCQPPAYVPGTVVTDGAKPQKVRKVGARP